MKMQLSALLSIAHRVTSWAEGERKEFLTLQLPLSHLSALYSGGLIGNERMGEGYERTPGFHVHMARDSLSPGEPTADITHRASQEYLIGSTRNCHLPLSSP